MPRDDLDKKRCLAAVNTWLGPRVRAKFRAEHPSWDKVQVQNAVQKEIRRIVVTNLTASEMVAIGAGGRDAAELHLRRRIESRVSIAFS